MLTESETRLKHKPVLVWANDRIMVNSCQNHLRKKGVKVREVPLDTTQQKSSVKITMYWGLDNIVKLKFTAHFDRCTILKVLNCLTKNFEP